MGKKKVQPNYRRRTLRLPDLDHSKLAVLNSLGSPGSRRVYAYALDQFIAWYCSEPRLAFNRIVVTRYRMYLESRRLAANTINQQLAAVRRLAHEAADAGLLSPELAAGISRVRGVKQLGFRVGNWLSADECSAVLSRARGSTLRAKRDYAMLAVLFGCGLRRSELVGLDVDDGENGLLKQLTKAVLERALEAEMTEHLGDEKHDPAGQHQGNPRNGKSRKTLKGDFGELELETPRDRQATFEPKIVGKRQTRWTGFDDKIISMYARGMTTREIQGHLEEIYSIEVSPTLISNVTEAVVEEVKQWQNRPLEQLYPIVYLDALMVKVRDEGHIQNKAIYVVLGVNLEGQKEVLGLWVAQSEGTKLWLGVLTEVKNRGVQDIFIACVDGLKGFPEAIESNTLQWTASPPSSLHSFLTSWPDDASPL